MKVRKLLLIIFFLLGGAVSSRGDTDLSNQELGGTIVRDPPKGLRVEDMTGAELRERYAQYKTGKRDDRDGYIILNQLTFNCGMNRVLMSTECQAFYDERLSLLKSRPEFNSLKDFRLSDRIRWQAEQEKKNAELAAKRKEEQERPRPGFGRGLIYGDKIVLHTDHPRSLRFFDIPKDDAVLCVEKSGDFRYQQAPGWGPSGGACTYTFCASKDVTPLPHRENYSPEVRLVSCKHPINPVPKLIVPLEDWVVVQSPGFVNLQAPFFIATTEYRGAGEGGPITPTAPFARVYGIDGKVLYEVGEKSNPPSSIISGLGADKTGAVFGLGEFVSFDNGCDDETSPHKMRRLFLWESSGETKQIDSSNPTPEVKALMTRFRINEANMPWFNWKKNSDSGE